MSGYLLNEDPPSLRPKEEEWKENSEKTFSHDGLRIKSESFREEE